MIDQAGHRSRQTDVIVVSEDHPRIYQEQEPSLYFVEGVRAAGEVKSALTTEGLRGIVAAAAQFKGLRADPGHGTLTHSSPSDVQRFGHCPPYFALALESEITAERIAKEMDAIFSKDPALRDGSLDALVVLDRGVWLHLGDGNGSFAMSSPDGGNRSGWVMLSAEEPMYHLIAWLSAVMPNTMRFTPILPAYLLPARPPEQPQG